MGFFIKKALILSLFSVLLTSCLDRSTKLDPSAAGALAGVAQLSWSSSLGEQDGFRIEQSVDGQSFSQVMTVPDGTNSAVVRGLASGQAYYFRIRAYNQAGSSAYSPVISIKP